MTADREFLTAALADIAALEARFLVQLGAPVPPKVDPPVDPHPVPPPTGNVVMLEFATISAPRKVQVTPGILYAVKLPKIPRATISITRDPASPPNMTVDCAISQTPGDFTWAMKPENGFSFGWAPTQVFHPCTALGNIESAGLIFGTALDMNTCPVKAETQDWYFNFKVENASGPLIYWYT